MRTHDRIVIGHHIMLNGYGHWLPNDPRGSGSSVVRDERLGELGPMHTGRKQIQPPRSELKEFYRRAEPLLEHESLWLDHAKRQAVGEALRKVVESRRYTVWACAVLSNHVHLCVRRHRDDALTILHHVAEKTVAAIRALPGVSSNHPLWSARPYKVFLYTPDDVRRTVEYIERNPAKEGLEPQTWSFVKPYDGFPFRNLAPSEH